MEYQDLLAQFAECDLAAIPSRQNRKDDTLEIHEVTGRRRVVCSTVVGKCNTEAELEKWVAGYRYGIDSDWRYLHILEELKGLELFGKVKHSGLNLRQNSESLDLFSVSLGHDNLVEGRTIAEIDAWFAGMEAALAVSRDRQQYLSHRMRA